MAAFPHAPIGELSDLRDVLDGGCKIVGFLNDELAALVIDELFANFHAAPHKKSAPERTLVVDYL